MRHTLLLSVTLAAIWLLNSGHYTPLILGLGVVSIILVLRIAHIMDVVDHEALPVNLTFKFPLYWAWLAKEIVTSNIDVVIRVWLKPKSIEPAIGKLRLSQTTDMGRVIYANSITLTPGTVTLDLQDDELTVHALNIESLEHLRQGEMDRRVTNLER